MINIVTVSSGWILQKIAERTAASAPDVFSVSHTPSPSARANLYVDLQNCFFKKSPVLDIGLFTHLHQNSMSDFQARYKMCDHICHMSSRYIEQFATVFPRDRMSVHLPFDVSSFSLKKDTIGIFQRGGWEGKGHNFMLSLASRKTSRNFKFLLVGKGWEEVVSEFNKYKIECEYHPDEEYSKYNSLYNSIDYLLIPSLWEGGPISMPEALACGVPTISSDVGFANTDIDVDYIYPPGDIDALCSILDEIYRIRYERRARVVNHSYVKFGNHIIDIVNNLEKK